MSVLGHSTLEKHKDLTSRVNIHIATATLIIQRIFHIYKGKFYVLAFLDFKIENKDLNKIGVGGLTIKVLRTPRIKRPTPILFKILFKILKLKNAKKQIFPL